MRITIHLFQTQEWAKMEMRAQAKSRPDAIVNKNHNSLEFPNERWYFLSTHIFNPERFQGLRVENIYGLTHLPESWQEHLISKMQIDRMIIRGDGYEFSHI